MNIISKIVNKKNFINALKGISDSNNVTITFEQGKPEIILKGHKEKHITYSIKG